MLRHALLSAALGLAAVPAVAADTYTIDPNHSQVRFVYDHLGFSNILGLIGGIEGELVHDDANPANSKVSVTIPVGEIRTGVGKMDQHLYADDFFDVATFPKATFTSTQVEAAGEGKLKVTGTLTIRDQSHPVTLDVTLNGRGEHPMRKTPAIGFDGTAELLRSAYGLGKYVPNIPDNVQVTVTIEANAKAG
jgi:polyisoprenoid-binding protein YceI